MQLSSPYPKICLLAIIISISLSFASCSNLIIVDKFEGRSFIKKGDTALLDWKFTNADLVEIEGIREEMPPEGTFEVNPETTKIYKFSATNSSDTISLDWFVEVLDAIRTGAESAAFPEMKESFLPSNYLTGFAGNASDNLPDRLKVMRTTASPTGLSNVRFLALDQFGNYLRGLASPAYHLTISSPEGKSLETNLLTEKWTSSPEKNLQVTFLIDNSWAAERNSEVLEALKSLAEEYRLIDNYTFAWINHSPPEFVQLTDSEAADFNKIEEPLPHGFNAFYKYTYLYLDSLGETSGDTERIIIPILFSPDNASIFFDASDLAQKARQTGTALYPISIGTAVNTNSLKYLADYSGGRFYSLDENSIENLKSIIQEIIFAQKSYFDLRFDSENSKSLVLGLQKGDIKLMDNFKIIDSPELQFADYQAIAGFNYKDTTITESFLPAIGDLAGLLKANPTITIELTGHSGIEGNENTTYDLALMRAQNVRRALLSQGVPASQIRVVSEGATQPIYYLEQFSWQSVYNRRVEVKWIVPEQLPFEILAEVCPSEAQALTKVEQWEKLGYKSYYERFLKNNSSAYRVKIWGFATLDEAETLATKLQVKYKIPMQPR